MLKALIPQIQSILRDPRVLCGFVALLLLSLAVASSGIVKPREINPLNPLASFSSSDFEDYFRATQVFLKGEDPYRVGQINDLSDMAREGLDLTNPLAMLAAVEKLKGVGTYLYPPLTAFLLSPLAGLGLEVTTAALVFQILSLIALIGWFVFMARELTPAAASGEAVPLVQVLAPGAPIWATAAVSLLVLYRFLDGNAGNGNIGFFLILLCGAGLLLAFRAGSALFEFLGGVLLGLATVMKITPGFLGLVLIGGRRVVAILGMGAGALLGLVAPALALGWSANLSALTNWYKLIIQTFSDVSFIRPWMNNQSISGAMGKWFIPGSDLKQGEFGLPWGQVQGAEEIAVYASAVKTANLSLTGLALFAALCVAWRGWQARRSAKLNASSAHAQTNPSAVGRGPELLTPALLELLTLALLVSLLVSGVSWYHAYSILLVPVALAAWQHFSGARPFVWRSFAGVLLAIFAFFGILQSLLSGNAREGLAMYSVFAAANLAIVIALIGRLILGVPDAARAQFQSGQGS